MLHSEVRVTMGRGNIQRDIWEFSKNYTRQNPNMINKNKSKYKYITVK